MQLKLGELKMSSEKSNPVAIAALLGPPPLLNGESAEIYNQLLARVVEAFGAEDDVILQILTKRFVDSHWESSRYSRHRAVMIDRRVRQSAEFQAERKKRQKEHRDAALEKIAVKLGQPRNEFVQMIEREALIQSTVEDVGKILERTPSEIEHNRAIEASVELLGQFEALIESAARRQDSALLLAERYAAVKQQRKPAKEIVEAEYVEVEASAQPPVALAPPLAPSDEVLSSDEVTSDVGTQNSSQPQQ